LFSTFIVLVKFVAIQYYIKPIDAKTVFLFLINFKLKKSEYNISMIEVSSYLKLSII